MRLATTSLNLLAALVLCLPSGFGCKQRRARSNTANAERSSLNAQLEDLAVAIETDAGQIVTSASSEVSAGADGIALNENVIATDRETEALQVAVRSLQNAFISIEARRSSQQHAAPNASQQTPEAIQQRLALIAAAVIARDLATTWSMRLREVSAGRAPVQQELWVELQAAANLVNAALDGNDVEEALLGLRKLTVALAGAQVAMNAVEAFVSNYRAPNPAPSTAVSSAPSSSSAAPPMPPPPVVAPPAVAVPAGLTGPIVTLGAGANHACALADSKVYCWGFNAKGQIGDGTKEDRRSAVLVMEGAKFLSVGRNHTCAIDSQDRALCWGDNFYFQAGIITHPRPSNPRTDRFGDDILRPTLLAGLGPVRKIVAGEHHSCAIKLDNRVTCFGKNDSGQVGVPSPAVLESSIVEPHPESIANLTDVADVVLGSNHSCARKSNNTVRCWGSNYRGQLANRRANDDGYRPPRARQSSEEYKRGTVFAPEHAGIRDIIQLTASGDQTCGKKADFSVICWGPLGVNGVPAVENDLASYNATFGGAAEISAGSELCALMLSNQLLCMPWRRFTHGEGAVFVRLSADAGRLTQFSDGFRHRCAIKTGNTVVCWGSNRYGALGNNSNQDSEEPVTVIFPPHRS